MLRSLEQKRKSVIRRQYLARRADFVANSQAYLSTIYHQIAQNIFELIRALPEGVIASFCPRADEASPEGLLSLLPKRQFAYPVVDGQDLSFWMPENRQAWRQGAFGIGEPDPHNSQRVDINDCPAVLVPGLVFDHYGWRIGYGKGFYDRALADYSGLKIGVCFSLQITPEMLPTESGDVRMDWIVSEKEGRAKVVMMASADRISEDPGNGC